MASVGVGDVDVTEVHDCFTIAEIMASICSDCGAFSFPPRADCSECMSESFAFQEVSRRGTIYTHSTVAAAPTGFTTWPRTPWRWSISRRGGGSSAG